MGVLRNLLLIVLAVSVTTFIALFGQLPALRRTPIGWLQRALCLHLPHSLKRIDGQVTGGRITARGRKLGQYLFYERNPIILILFLLLLTGSAALFLYPALPLLPRTLLLPIPPLLALPYTFTYLTATAKSHLLTPSTHRAHLTHYPYDHALYRPAVLCRTCHLAKPARSKHCALCRACVAKADHHCPWVNACLGRGNYRFFLALLLSLTLLLTYGAYLSYFLLRAHLATNDSGSAPFWSSAHSAVLGAALVRAVNAGGLSVAGVGLLAAATAPLPLGLLAYHAYLVWAGMTTNESAKWADWRDDMADGVVFRASRRALRARLSHLAHQSNRADGASGDAIQAILGGDQDEDVHVPWPIHSDQVLVRSTDGRPPAGQEALWTRVWELGEVENVYDLGGWENLLDMLRGR